MSETNNNSMMKNLKYVFLLIGILALVASYFLVFTKYNKKVDDIKPEITSLQVRYAELVDKNNNKDAIVTKTEETNKEVEKVMSKFDGGITYQSVIMDTYNMTQDLEIQIPSLSLTPVADEYAFGQLPSTNPNGSSSAALAEYKGLIMTYNITSLGTYDQMKTTINSLLNANGKRKVPTTISFSYESTKQEVAMSIAVSEYAIAGGDRVQSEVKIPAYMKSTPNVFYNDTLKDS